jgi:hypothetical protein
MYTHAFTLVRITLTDIPQTRIECGCQLLLWLAYLPHRLVHHESINGLLPGTPRDLPRRGGFCLRSVAGPHASRVHSSWTASEKSVSTHHRRFSVHSGVLLRPISLSDRTCKLFLFFFFSLVCPITIPASSPRQFTEPKKPKKLPQIHFNKKAHYNKIAIAPPILGGLQKNFRCPRFQLGQVSSAACLAAA